MDLANWTPKNAQEAVAAWRAHRHEFENEYGIVLPDVRAYTTSAWRRNFELAMDALPTASLDPNSAIPAMLSTLIDPTVIEAIFAPNKVAEIYGEVKEGDWTKQTAMFPIVESMGEVSSYGDFSDSGMAQVNFNWPQVQSYLFQIIKMYGELEIARAGLARINYVAQKDRAAALLLNKFSNLCYAFGVGGLENYGAFNNPFLSAALTPATKAEAGYGTKWILNGEPCAANEIFSDIQALNFQLVTQTNGLVDENTKTVLAMSPPIATALLATNTFRVNVKGLIKENFGDNMEVVTVPQMGVASAANSFQGIAAGNMVQLVAREIDGQRVGFCAFNEKLRAHPIVREVSSFKQKETSGSWGTVIRMPLGVATMIGV